MYMHNKLATSIWYETLPTKTEVLNYVYVTKTPIEFSTFEFIRTPHTIKWVDIIKRCISYVNHFLHCKQMPVSDFKRTHTIANSLKLLISFASDIFFVSVYFYRTILGRWRENKSYPNTFSLLVSFIYSECTLYTPNFK